jgi:hypothetical protein
MMSINRLFRYMKSLQRLCKRRLRELERSRVEMAIILKNTQFAYIILVMLNRSIARHSSFEVASQHFYFSVIRRAVEIPTSLMSRPRIHF